MQAKVLIRLPETFVLPKNWEPGEVKVLAPRDGETDTAKEERFHDGTVLFATSYGRILFNETLPTDYPFVNDQVAKAACPRSSMTSPCVTPPSRWPPR